MPVPSHRCEPGNRVMLDEVGDLRELRVRRTPIASDDDRITAVRPWFARARRQVLRIGPHAERSRCVAPNLPSGFGSPQAPEKPCLLIDTENSLGRPILT